MKFISLVLLFLFAITTAIVFGIYVYLYIFLQRQNYGTDLNEWCADDVTSEYPNFIKSFSIRGFKLFVITILWGKPSRQFTWCKWLPSTMITNSTRREFVSVLIGPALFPLGQESKRRLSVDNLIYLVESKEITAQFNVYL